MAILHKNISAEGDIHNPKWFSGANNGDVAWRNELGVLESTDELVLPAALDFVDGSATPPTSNSGDIYVLSSGASVNAGWGTVALGDWVRYDGTTWNVITPQKSSLCYNETTDALNSYDGSTWSAIGGGGASIYTADDALTGDRTVDLDGNDLNFNNGSDVLYRITNDGGHTFGGGGGTNNLFRFKKGVNEIFNLGTTSNQGFSNIGVFNFKTGSPSSNNRIEINTPNDNQMSWYNNAGTQGHRIRYGSFNHVAFFKNGDFGWRGFTVGGDDRISTEDISLQGSTLIKGNGTSTGSALSIYDNDTTPTKVFEVLDNSTIKTNGNAGFTGTGAYTNFTIENGIITNAS